MATESQQGHDTSLQDEIVRSHQNAFQWLWDTYRYHVQRNQFSLQLADDILTRVIFWAPTPSNLSERTSAHRWREVAYGLISLHRMAMDLALSHDHVVNSYGTTLQPSLAPVVPATALRIALTVTHNLMPTILELAQSSNDNPQRQATCRLWLERIKFIIRLVLISSYWKQIRNNESNDEVTSGLLQNGGMFYGAYVQSVPSVANVRALRIRRQYVGRRTGRRVISSIEASSADEEQQQNRIMWIRLMLGEILRLYRPLYWAQAERNETRTGDTQKLWRAWILTMIMEVASLQCLSGALSRDNPQSQAELGRRRMKLLLYLLRSPAWDKTSEPSVVRTAALLRRVPLLGKLVETYVWEWLLYWKHPFVSEEE